MISKPNRPALFFFQVLNISLFSAPRRIVNARSALKAIDNPALSGRSCIALFNTYQKRSNIMGMDVYGNNSNYFRANIWSWRAICYAMELAGFEVPLLWETNYGAGFSSQKDCTLLANKINTFLKSRDGDTIVWETESVRIDAKGRFVNPDTSDSRSPYYVYREHLKEFIDFLYHCDGFEIR